MTTFIKLRLFFAVVSILGLILGLAVSISALGAFVVEHLWNFVAVNGLHHPGDQVSFLVTWAALGLLGIAAFFFDLMFGLFH